MNTVEFAIKDGIPYAIDFMNPAPDMDVNSLGKKNFDWMVTHMADMTIRFAKDSAVSTGSRYYWYSMVKRTASAGTPAKKVASKKAATSADQPVTEPKKRGRKPGSKNAPAAAAVVTSVASNDTDAPVPVKRGRGRPRKNAAAPATPAKKKQGATNKPTAAQKKSQTAKKTSTGSNTSS
jgi:hypothetical protein